MPSERPSPIFKILPKNKRPVKIMIATGGAVGLSEGIIDDTLPISSLRLENVSLVGQVTVNESKSVFPYKID